MPRLTVARRLGDVSSRRYRRLWASAASRRGESSGAGARSHRKAEIGPRSSATRESARAESRARCGDFASGNLKATNEKEVPDWPGGGWVGAGPASEELVIRYRGFYWSNLA